MEEKDLPLVSVIVPCYNHEKYVKETIESIVNQTYKNIELIVIDDGSKDNSVKIIQELADKYNFTFIHRHNKGLSNTLNEGISLSIGEYICFCASDDFYTIDKIEKQVNFMEINKNDMICYTNMIKFYKNGFKRNIQNQKKISGFIFEKLFLQDFWIPAGTVMYKKVVFQKIGLFDNSLDTEDFDMFLRIAKRFEIGFIDEFLFFYRAHENNSSSNIRKMENNSIKILNKWKNEENYNKAININKLLFFVHYASLNRIEALKRIPISLSVLKSIHLYKGLLRLLIPKFIYNLIR